MLGVLVAEGTLMAMFTCGDIFAVAMGVLMVVSMLVALGAHLSMAIW